MPNESYDVVIIGSGVAGLSAGIYAARYNLSALIIGDELGGATTTAWIVENYPGYKAIDGYDLVMKMKEQVEALGVHVQDGSVLDIKAEGGCYVVKTDKTEVGATTVILATGSARRKLGLPNEKELNGKGIHYCTTCDSPLYKGKTIGIVGGGDASLKGANLAAQFAKKIYLITRRVNDLRGEPTNIERLKKVGDRIEILYLSEVKQLNGSQRLESVTLSRPYKGSDTLKLDGLFIEIGAEPNNKLALSLGATTDEHGYLAVTEMMQTNVAGLFAAGDIVNETGHFKQDIVGAAQGAIAATSAYEYIHNDAPRCSWHARPILGGIKTRSEPVGVNG